MTRGALFRPTRVLPQTWPEPVSGDYTTRDFSLVSGLLNPGAGGECDACRRAETKTGGVQAQPRGAHARVARGAQQPWFGIRSRNWPAIGAVARFAKNGCPWVERAHWAWSPQSRRIGPAVAVRPTSAVVYRLSPGAMTWVPARLWALFTATSPLLTFATGHPGVPRATPDEFQAVDK